MKLKAGSDVFKYSASYWTDSSTLNPSSMTPSNMDDIDAKLEAFNTYPFVMIKVCYKTLDNCFEHTMDSPYSSAQALFSSGFHRDETIDKTDWTDLFLPPGSPTWYEDFWNGNGGGKCDPQRLGFNTQCNDNNWARIGYCVNLPDQSCQPHDNSDADSPIGIGLRTQNWPNYVNAPFGEYFIHGAGSAGVQSFQHQAWLFVAGLDPTPQPTPQPTLQPTSTCNIDELKDSDGNCLPKCEAGDALVDGVCRKVCTDRRRLSRNFGPEFSSDTSGDGPSLQHMRHLADEDCVDIEDANGDCPAEVMALGATGAICFTGDSLLTLQDGSNIKFNDLQVSESIRVDSSRVDSSRVESSYEDE